MGGRGGRRRQARRSRENEKEATLGCYFFLMIRRPPRSTPLYSSAASDVYKGQHYTHIYRLIRRQLGLLKKKLKKTIFMYDNVFL